MPRVSNYGLMVMGLDFEGHRGLTDDFGVFYVFLDERNFVLFILL